MAITIRVNGQDYTNFISASCEIQLDALSSSFNMEVTTTEGTPLPFLGGEKCEIYINNEKKLTGFIEACDGSYSDTAHSLSFSGRDKTADLVDSTIGKLNDLVAPITLKAICEAVIAHIGADITVVQATNTVTFNKAEDVMAAEPGQNAYEFLQSVASKRQVLLSSDADGNLLLTQSQSVLSEGRLQNKLNNSKNNILTSSWSFDNTSRFNKYEAISQLNPIALNFAGKTDLGAVVEQSGGITLDNEIRKGRQYIFKPDKSASSEENLKRAKWELNMRKARGVSYSATVGGHTIATNNTTVWDTNTLIQVADIFAGIGAVMLCNKITFSTNLNEGDQTVLELVPEGSYTLQTNEPRSSTAKVGAGVFSFLTEETE